MWQQQGRRGDIVAFADVLAEVEQEDLSRVEVFDELVAHSWQTDWFLIPPTSIPRVFGDTKIGPICS